MGKKISLLIAGLFLIVLIYNIYNYYQKPIIVFLDVGQGSSSYLRSDSGFEVVIDSGKTRKVLQELSKYRPFWDRHIDLLIATHPDADHIGAMPDILKRFEVDTYMSNGRERLGNGPYDAIIEYLESDKVSTKHIFAEAGDTLTIDENIKMVFYFPFLENVDEMGLNESSLVFKLNMMGSSFLVTGDSPKNVENYLAREYGNQIKSNFLIVGHHGSNTSTSNEFLNAVNPEKAIISAGKDNPYGHPHQDVVGRLEKKGIEIYSTAQMGNIEINN